jgi:hypothetical protein
MKQEQQRAAQRLRAVALRNRQAGAELQAVLRASQQALRAARQAAALRAAQQAALQAALRAAQVWRPVARCKWVGCDGQAQPTNHRYDTISPEQLKSEDCKTDEPKLSQRRRSAESSAALKRNERPTSAG